jgi:hypothetical protein
MRRLTNVALATALLSAPLSASDDPMIFTTSTTGNVLMKLCGQNWEPGKYDPCGSYLTGVIDGLGIAGDELCPPNVEGIVNQMTYVVYLAVREQPERWHYPASWLAKDALQKHFACS